MTKHTYTQKIHLKQKGQLLINKRQRDGSSHFGDPKGLFEFSNDMHDICETIDK